MNKSAWRGLGIVAITAFVSSYGFHALRDVLIPTRLSGLEKLGVDVMVAVCIAASVLAAVRWFQNKPGW
jgi:hypothetical protein